MRTSGAPTDGTLTLIPVAVAVLMIVLLAGGPSEFLKTAEETLRGVAAALVTAARAL
jgi:hypothetical protein